MISGAGFFNPQFGPLNVLLNALGLSGLTRAWLGDFALALPAAPSAPAQYGFCMILFLAGMQHISEEYYEVSSLDGANAFQQFVHITILGLRAEIGVALITTIIAALRVFDLVYVTTRGGPGNSHAGGRLPDLSFRPSSRTGSICLGNRNRADAAHSGDLPCSSAVSRR